jgi:hypothetical protein
MPDPKLDPTPNLIPNFDVFLTDRQITMRMKRGELSIFACIAVVVSLLFPLSHEAFAVSDEYMQMITKMIDEMQVKPEAKEKQSIEFCPDNTCDFFLARRKIASESLKDFAFIYEYFFSDYYVLEEWRRGEEPGKRAQRILSSPAYKSCAGRTDEESARCVLRLLSREGQIRLYFVRYDEGERNVVPVKLEEAIATSSLKR